MSAQRLPDRLYLWYLGDPRAPRPVGELHLVMNQRGVSLRYTDSWLEDGFPLSEDLPLSDIEHFPKEKDTAAGAVDDARPDRWGERVIRLLDNPPRLSLLECLYFAGDDRFGALGVSTAREHYRPHEIGPLPRLTEIDAVHDVVRRILANERVDERQKRLISPGATMGGARPKALFELDGRQWVLKFADVDRPDEPLIEYATMTLAARAGITVARTRSVPFAAGTAVAVERFDRATGRRIHALSANVALRAVDAELAYPEMALLLRRRATPERERDQMHEIFRRLIFNILIDNTDDHEKNHVFLVLPTRHYELAPAFDVLPAATSLGHQSMRVGAHGHESSIENAMTGVSRYWLTPKTAREQARRVAQAIDSWRAHFSAQGISQTSIEELARHIDRTELLEQRKALRRTP